MCLSFDFLKCWNLLPDIVYSSHILLLKNIHFYLSKLCESSRLGFITKPDFVLWASSVYFVVEIAVDCQSFGCIDPRTSRILGQTLYNNTLIDSSTKEKQGLIVDIRRGMLISSVWPQSHIHEWSGLGSCSALMSVIHCKCTVGTLHVWWMEAT